MKLRLLIISTVMMVLLNGCAMRIGLQPDVRINQGSYPPVNGTVRVFCLPCFEFDGWGTGLMLWEGWPVLFYTE